MLRRLSLQRYTMIVVFVATSIFLFTVLVPWCRERFGQRRDVTFMTASETSNFLKEDADGYVRSLSVTDLHARNASSVDDYIQSSTQHVSAASKQEKAKLIKLTRYIDRFLEQYNAPVPWTMNFKNLAKIPWVFAFMHGSTYESGYPHTRMNVIILPIELLKSVDLAKTLLHEKMHLYQRLYPHEMSAILDKYGYVRWKERRAHPLARSNPDLDPWIYLDPSTSKPMVASYTSTKPSGISDITLDHPAYEHPYEKMAYDIASMLPS